MNEQTSESAVYDPPLRAALISPCERYRYDLVRRWDASKPMALWVMLNPSTADALTDDPTIRRVVRFSKDGGFGGAVVVNLFAYRATKPATLTQVAAPVGPQNIEVIKSWMENPEVGQVIVAWGTSWTKVDLARPSIETFAHRAGRPLYCLGRTKDGHPRHPLYVPASQPFEPFPSPFDAVSGR